MSHTKKASVGEIHEVDLRDEYSSVGVSVSPPTTLDLSHTMGKIQHFNNYKILGSLVDITMALHTAGLNSKSLKIPTVFGFGS